MATSLRHASRVVARRFSSATTTTTATTKASSSSYSAVAAADKAATKGPKLPLGNDPASYHPIEHAVADTNRWKWITLAFGVPVFAFGILTAMNDHPHHDAPPPYEYLKRATRSPRFPWGDEDLIGTPADRAEWAKSS